MEITFEQYIDGLIDYITARYEVEKAERINLNGLKIILTNGFDIILSCSRLRNGYALVKEDDTELLLSYHRIASTIDITIDKWKQIKEGLYEYE